MNKRKRKKWLKENNLYVNPKDIWNLDVTIAEFILPRLKLFKKKTISYPGYGEMDTPEKWDEALDKMILAFEYILDDDWWIDNPEYDYTDGLHMKFEPCENSKFHELIVEEEDWVKDIEKNKRKEEQRRQNVIDEGLQLFAKYYRHLWD